MFRIGCWRKKNRHQSVCGMRTSPMALLPEALCSVGHNLVQAEQANNGCIRFPYRVCRDVRRELVRLGYPCRARRHLFCILPDLRPLSYVRMGTPTLKTLTSSSDARRGDRMSIGRRRWLRVSTTRRVPSQSFLALPLHHRSFNGAFNVLLRRPAETSWTSIWLRRLDHGLLLGGLVFRTAGGHSPPTLVSRAVCIAPNVSTMCEARR